jgi:hypothetical protein
VRVTLELADPMPEAERGTLEFATSAVVCRHVVCVRMSVEDARLLVIGMDIADTQGLPSEYLRPMAHLQRALDETLPPS